MKTALVLFAAGSGNRFSKDEKKQFVRIHGVPVYMHALRAFGRGLDSIDRVVLVVPERDVAPVRRALHATDPHVHVIAGGATRIHSYLRAIDFLEDEQPDIVITHDAVRPAVDPKVIREAHASFVGSKADALITFRPVGESLFRIDARGGVSALDRDPYGLGQTPYFFRYAALRAAWMRAKRVVLHETMDIFELMPRLKVRAFTTDIPNPKLTYPEDLIVVTTLLKKKHG